MRITIDIDTTTGEATVDSSSTAAGPPASVAAAAAAIGAIDGGPAPRIAGAGALLPLPSAAFGAAGPGSPGVAAGSPGAAAGGDLSAGAAPVDVGG
jgi:hypothetical protein